MGKRPVFIAGASGFWGDTDAATAQLLQALELDYIVYDYLSEITLALLARARAADPDKGFIHDFERAVLPLLGRVKSRGIKLIANAGGLNPTACAQALQTSALASGHSIKVAAVEGDNVSASLSALLTDMFDGSSIPSGLLSANAYLGVSGIVAALEDGADIVITGRCADSALALAPLVHRFGWAMDDWDRLAQGSLAGHLIECGCQGAGGLFTDWRSVPGWENMGFPIAECHADGDFRIIKPDGTGGLITPLTVGEQMLYEIGDPGDYRLPDVVCDFREVELKQDGPDAVRVTGARGRPATPDYKVSVTWQDGWRLTALLMIGGIEAVAKARRTGDAILARTARLGAERGLHPFSRTLVEVLGAEDSYGPHARAADVREVVLKVSAMADDRAILDLLSKEVFPSATAMAQGITGAAAGRPKPTPVIRGGGVTIPKTQVEVTIAGIGSTRPVPVAVPAGEGGQNPDRTSDDRPSRSATPYVVSPGERLIDLAVGRSGDKGDMVNIGILARNEASWHFLREHLSAEAVEMWLDHLEPRRVERFELPGSRGLNFVLHGVLEGGGLANLHMDAQGKAVAGMLLDMPVDQLCL